jgi:hypothetical protein
MPPSSKLTPLFLTHDDTCRVVCSSDWLLGKGIYVSQAHDTEWMADELSGERHVCIQVSRSVIAIS